MVLIRVPFHLGLTEPAIDAHTGTNQSVQREMRRIDPLDHFSLYMLLFLSLPCVVRLHTYFLNYLVGFQ